jgi:hypothetical protein
VPDLRIVDADIFAAAKAMKAELGGDRPHKTRPRHLLSGLLKCGCCGSGYIVMSRDKRGLSWDVHALARPVSAITGARYP